MEEVSQKLVWFWPSYSLKSKQGALCYIYMEQHVRSVPQRDHVEISALMVEMFEANMEFVIRYCSSPKWKTSP